MSRLAWIGVGAAAVVFVGVFVPMQAGKMVAERERAAAVSSLGETTSWADGVCISVGLLYTPAKGDKTKHAKWGEVCAAKIRQLASDAVAAGQAAHDTLTAFDGEQEKKRAAYVGPARKNNERVRLAQHQMEVAIEAAQDGRLGPDYFDGLNRSFGLRPYQRPDAPPSSDAPGGGEAQGAPVT